MTNSKVILMIFILGALMFTLRAIPFLIFSKKEPPKFLRFAEKYIPVIAIAVLFVICLKEKTTDLLLKNDFSTPELIAGIAGTITAILLHIWKNNSMLSIFGSTILFLILKNIM